jgi:parallel beta-helix repeat protein
MAVNLSPVGGAAAQFFDNNGNPLTGGKLFTYAAGTTTPAATYTSSSGNVAHTNPIILDSAGRVPSGEIWISNGVTYKFVIRDANDVLIGTYDNIPPGVSGTSADVTYTPAGTGAVTTTVQAKLRQTVSVKDFGAVGNGIVDDTTTIQAALNASLCVELPEGTYVVSNLTLRSGQTLKGCGRSSVLSVKAGTTGTVVGVVGTDFNAGRLDNVKLQDFSIVGSSSAANGVRFENVSRGSAVNLYITGCNDGVKMERVELVDFTECQMLSNGAYGVNATRDSDAFLNSWVSFTNCIINGNVSGGVLLQDTASPVFVNTKVINNFDFGVQAQVKASKIGTVRCTYFQMTACDIDSNHNASIRLYNQANFSIANTWISGGRTVTQSSLNPAGQGIFVEDSSYGTLAGNIIFACGGVGIEIKGSSEYNSIVGGWVGGNGNSEGILINAGSHHTVSNVTVVPSGGSGFTQATGVKIDNTDDPATNGHLVVSNMVVGHTTNYNIDGGNQTKVSLNGFTDIETFNAGDSYSFKVDDVEYLNLTTGALRPGNDGLMSLGISTKKWNDVWASNGTIQTSDKNQKTNIVSEPLGLNFIKLLKPVQYQFIDGGGHAGKRQHHGLIAQDFKNILDSLGIDHAAYIENVSENESVAYGMRYTELISSLIKSVQELSTEIDMLKAAKL